MHHSICTSRLKQDDAPKKTKTRCHVTGLVVLPSERQVPFQVPINRSIGPTFSETNQS